jgi:hypothetical protein
MNAAASSYLTSVLIYQAPSLLVCLVAFVFALVHMRTAPLPSILTLSGVGILAVTAIVVIVAQTCLISTHESGSAGVASLGRMMMIVGVAGSCGRAMGTALLVAAIFAGRRGRTENRADEGSGPNA